MTKIKTLWGAWCLHNYRCLRALAQRKVASITQEKSMTAKTIDQQRLDEITEWCRNCPEDAAVRIAVAEGLFQEIERTKSERKNHREMISSGDRIMYVGRDDPRRGLFEGFIYIVDTRVYLPSGIECYRIIVDDCEKTNVARDDLCACRE